MQVKDCGESECRSVTERIEVVTSPYTKVGRLPHSGYNLYKKLLELSKGGKQMNEIKSCAPTDLWTTWEQIQWNKCEHEVRKLQARIVKAQMSGRHNKVKALQWMLTHSFYGKALAVKRVTSNGGKKTAGVDHVLWNTPNQKMDAIASLKRRGYHPQPLRRVNIKKSNGKLRPLGIPTLKDRAMQALYHMALDPVAETTADTHSYGFRKERSTKDAKEMCFTVLARKIAPQWVLEGDIKGCFDHISHEWLLNHIPMDKVILRKWLKSGYVFHNKLYPTYEGTPQGGIISPTLANMVLNGMQTMLSERFKVRMGKNYYNTKINLVRYADDFIVTGKDKEILENKVKPAIKEFLAERGLTLSEEKTKITHIDEGFDFLGYNFRKFNGTLIVKPSVKSVQKLLDKVKSITRKYRAISQVSLIRILNPIIRGWSNYYKTCSCGKTKIKVDYLLYKKIRRWADRRHPKKGKHWVSHKYFHTRGKNHWRFGTWVKKQGEKMFYPLISVCDVPKTKHILIVGEANPYSEQYTTYFDKRHTQNLLEHFNGRYALRNLWEKQMRRCKVCGEPITTATPWVQTHLVVNNKRINYLAHENCCKFTNITEWRFL